MTSIGGSIANSLGVGSGIDVNGLVSDLVDAVRTPKAGVITSKQTLNNARISALASASSSLDTFSNALSSLLSGTGFSGQPVSNDPTIASVSLLPGGTPTGLPAQIEVQQLAAGQTLESASLASKTSTVGTGTLTLSTASGNFDITIDGTNNTLEGLAAAINGKSTGVTASVVTDNRGARLILKGATGAANDFTLSVAPGATGAMQQLTFDGTTGGMMQKQAAQDAIINIDNVEMHFDSNVVETAIPYVRIDLNKAAPGTKVTLASDQPTTTLRDLVVEFVDAYNTLRSALNAATAAGSTPATSGALSGDAGARDMMRQLARLSSTQLSSTGPYKTLAEIGVSTNRDGTLKVDTDRLDAVIAADPAAVTQMLNPSVASTGSPGLAGLMTKVTASIKGEGGSLTTSQKKYEVLQTSLAKQLEDLDSDMADYEQQLTKVYSKMQSQLSALKATQTYLEQQIAVWNGSGD